MVFSYGGLDVSGLENHTRIEAVDADVHKASDVLRPSFVLCYHENEAATH
jgi:hypothetical protein